MSEQEIFKIMLVGDTGTGKTSFLTQLMYRSAERLPKPTTQMSFFTMRISKPPTVVQIWDSSGSPKFYYSMLGALQKFRAILIFIDLTNEYTYKKACLIADQLVMYKDIDVHIVESKVEIVQLDPMKKKVTKSMLKKLVGKFNGGIFQYRLKESVEPIIQQVIEWDRNKALSDPYRQEEEEGVRKEPVFQRQTQTPVCTECTLF